MAPSSVYVIIDLVPDPDFDADDARQRGDVENAIISVPNTVSFIGVRVHLKRPPERSPVYEFFLSDSDRWHLDVIFRRNSQSVPAGRICHFVSHLTAAASA